MAVLAASNMSGTQELIMAMVLCTGWDQSLLDTRTLILQSAGHEVRQARTQNELVSACEKHQFDVVVIGQTVSLKMKRLISALVKQHCPNARILELYQPHMGKAVEDADSWLVVPAEIPSALAEEVARLANIAAS
jgi:CheY-like chemotaxis protein